MKHYDILTIESVNGYFDGSIDTAVRSEIEQLMAKDVEFRQLMEDYGNSRQLKEFLVEEVDDESLALVREMNAVIERVNRGKFEGGARRMPLGVQMLVGIALGVTAAFVFSESYMAWRDAVGGVGRIFVNAIRMLAMPLMVLSILTGIISIDKNRSIVSISVKAICAFLLLSLLGAAIAIVVTMVVTPGEGVEIPVLPLGNVFEKSSIVDWDKVFIPSVVSFVPSNIVTAFANCQMQAILFMSIFFGCFVRRAESGKREKVYRVVVFLNETVQKMASFVMRFAPLGVFALVMSYAGKEIYCYHRSVDTFVTMSGYVVTVLIALVIVGVVVLPLMLGCVAKVSPLAHLRGTYSSLIVALTTCSSYCALPSLVYEAKNKMGVSDDVSGFVMPFGITFNKLGTIVFECVAMTFIMQVVGVEFGLVEFVSLVVLSIVTVLCAPSVPMMGVFALAIMLKSMDLPVELIGAFVVVDALCDMPRSVLNSYSVSCVAVVVAKSEGEELMV